MSSIKKVRLSESVIDAIKEMIVNDGFNPGDKFYSLWLLPGSCENYGHTE
jgi:DNA-binding GntR family transcriptional regulator